MSDLSRASGHSIGAANGTETEFNAAAVPPRGGGPGFRAQDKPAEQSRELETLSGCQRLPAGSRVGECRRWTAQIGVSVDEDGALSARVLEGVTSTPREPHVLPFSGDLIGHGWSLGVHRILGPVEETVDTQKAADKRVYRMLELLGDELDAIRDGTEVHDAGGMQSVLLRVLRLLVGTAHPCGYGRTDSADTRVRPGRSPPLWRRQRRGNLKGWISASSGAQDSWMVWIAATRRIPHLGAQAPRPRTVCGPLSHCGTSCLWNAPLVRTSGLGTLPPLTRLPGEHLSLPPHRHRRSHSEWLLL